MQLRVDCFSTRCGYLRVFFNRLLIGRIHFHSSMTPPPSVYCVVQMARRIFAKHVLLSYLRLAAAALQLFLLIQTARGRMDF